MGKGGVGKTALSVALGKAAERFEKKVLLLEIGDTDAIRSIFNKKTLPEVPLKLSSYEVFNCGIIAFLKSIFRSDPILGLVR